jgi:hypothetical protein
VGRRKDHLPQGETKKLRIAATHALKSMSSLHKHPLNYSAFLVTETQVVIQGREAKFSGS